jgi:transcriptional regulator
MYLPAAFQVTELEALHQFIDDYGFAILISQGDEAPFATHLPCLLDRSAGPQGTLVSHLAKANPHGRYADGEPVLMIFQGPHGYISPTWYAAENVVPTWNYTAVHAYGRFEPIFDTAEILDIVTATVEKYERRRDPPWTFDRESPFAARMAQQVVGFRIEITRLEGKWKLSQNHPLERRQQVIAGLSSSTDPGDQALAAAMQAVIPAG